LATRTPALTAAERISLLGDEWRMVRSGRHDVGTYLDLAAAFARDETPEVVGDLAGRLGAVMGDIADPSQRPAFQAWVRARFRPALDAIGLTDGLADTDAVNSRRGVLLQLLSSDPDVQKRARELAQAYMARPASISPTLVSPVLQVAAAGGDAALYDEFVARMTAATAAPDTYYRYFNALPAFRDPALVKRTQEFALTQARSQDAPQLLGQLLVSASTQDGTWALVKTEWPALVARFGTFQGIPNIVGALGAFCSADRATEIKAFFDAHPVPESARALQQSLERIATCSAVKARQAPAFATWLAAQ
jgi:puromycin-sensitive aminopeptidase